jgi:type IV secretory pathway VirB10-like protein
MSDGTEKSAVPEIESPTGIELDPEPPNAVRLSKRAGILALAVVGIVAAMIGYGIFSRKDRTIGLLKPDDLKGLTAAIDAGKIVASKVPERSLMDQRSDVEVTEEDDQELRPPDLSGSTGAVPSPRMTQPVSQPPPAPAYREPTPEEKRRALMAQQQMDALSAPTGTGRMSAGVSPTPTVPANEVAQLTALLQALQGKGSAGSQADVAGALARFASQGGTGNEGESFREQNMQDDKEAFLARSRGPDARTSLRVVRQPPGGPYEIKAGWDIPAVLEQELNSDLPGEVRALVRENVYDSATGEHLLIPQGSRLVGLYDSRIGYGQDGMMVVWNRLIFPDGSSIDLEGMAGQDARGRSGLRDKVDSHYDRLIGFAAMTSAFSAAFQLSQTRRDGSVLAYPSPAEIAGSAVGRELSQLGAQVTRRNLNIQPTIKVPVGYRFNVRVNRDMAIE